ncbi:EAL domain-containing protein [Marinomonas mediterranea]|uniref:bifunctional diguanylate cyclase/phosphodiesterase n=1 Tax=Marinomonas mediterranea TaxID=119864 RepID=UPI00234B5456|nr:EAL domain-containing protein [Marinomonas mediterranea]WCN11969.1 EAL domain-containing protein [Marinomonas mediterranea]
MFKSFRARLVLFIVGLLAVVQVGTAIAVLNSLKADNYRQGVHAIDVAVNVLKLQLGDRAKQLTTGVGILASDFGFKRAVATQDIGTIKSVLENHGARISSDSAMLFSPNGKLIASTQEVQDISFVTQRILEARRQGLKSINNLVGVDGYVSQLVLVPVRAPNLIAWVGMSFELDEIFAQHIASITQLDVSFVSEQSAEIKHIVSSLPKDDLNWVVTPSKLKDYIETPMFTDNEAYLSSAVKLDEKGGEWGIVHLPYAPWLKGYEEARNNLMLIFAFTLLLAALVALVMARSLSRPIQKLVGYAQAIGLGKTEHAPKVAGEFGVLANTMNTMEKAILNREEEIIFRSSHDFLTGLYNRSALERELTSQLPRSCGALVRINIRRFKDINSMMGFDAGDEVLKQTGTILSDISPDVEYVARTGGDEFTVILSKHHREEDCLKLQEIIQHEIEKGINQRIRLKVSIGVLPLSADITTANDAMRRIDITSGRAKERELGIAFYQDGLDEINQRNLTIINDIDNALLNNQLFMVYQPKIAVREGCCYEAEALVRWVHPELGFVPPDEFIGLLEQTGNVQQLTFWVLEQVIDQVSTWWAGGDKVTVAVNLSALDLVNESLPDWLTNKLNEKGLPVSAISLEVTESAVMSDADKVVSVLERLQEKQFHLAIDDFGTGQSALSYLRDLPVNEVKVDRAFVQYLDTNDNDKYIVRATIELSHSLGFKVTAEGAENKEGVEILKTLGCDKIQGYYFSKPLAPDDYMVWCHDFNDQKENA